MNEPDGPELPSSAPRGGEGDALEFLYRRYGSLVYRVAYRLTQSAADADDVVQEVFLALPRTLRRFDARSRIETWLKQVTTRTALVHLRGRRRRREVSLADRLTATTRGRPSTAIDRIELERAIGSLPESLRVVFVLKEVEGLSHAEIAETLGIRVNASEQRLYRARRHLRRRLEEEGP